MYMTKPKQVKIKLSENTGKTFSVIMPPFTSRGGGIITEMTVHLDPGIERLAQSAENASASK